MILCGWFICCCKVLLILVLVVLGWLGYVWYVRIVIICGIEQQDMDWNVDGSVSCIEVLQVFYVVGVDDIQEGNWYCCIFYWCVNYEQICVDCKIVFGEVSLE